MKQQLSHITRHLSPLFAKRIPFVPIHKITSTFTLTQKSHSKFNVSTLLTNKPTTNNTFTQRINHNHNNVFHNNNTINKRYFCTSNQSTLDMQTAQMIMKANNSYGEGNYQEAIKLLTKVINLTPYALAPRINRAAAFYQLGDIEGCKLDCENVLDLASTLSGVEMFQANAHARLAQVYLAQEKYEKALEEINTALNYFKDQEFDLLKKKARTLIDSTKVKVIIPKNEDDSTFFQQLTESHDVEVRESEVHGRGIFATRHFEEGETVLSLYPYMVMADPNSCYVQVPPSESEEASKRMQEQADKGLFERPKYCSHCLEAIPCIVIPNFDDMAKITQASAVDLKGLRESIENFCRSGNPKKVSHDKVVECESCKERYCSDHCKSDAYQQYHRILCKKNFHADLLYDKSERASGRGETTLFIAKILAKLHQKLPPGVPFQLDTELKRLVYAEVTPENLKFDEDQFPVSEYDLFVELQEIFRPRELTAEFYTQLKTILKLNLFQILTHSVYALLRKVEHPDLPKLNDQGEEVSDDDEGGEGDGNVGINVQHLPSVDGGALLTMASLMNHSCLPNLGMVAPTIDAQKVEFFARRKIEKGEELLWRYSGKPGMSRQERREDILTNYFFQCRCDFCESGSTEVIQPDKFEINDPMMNPVEKIDEHEHEHEHKHDHDHKHEHEHKHDHDHKHKK